MIIADGKHTLMLTYTIGTQTVCCCGVDQEQAVMVLEIIDQPEPIRKAYGTRMDQMMQEFRRKKSLSPDTQIAVGRPGGISKPIHWRVCLFLSYALLSDDQIWLTLLKKRLSEFIHGNLAKSMFGNRR